MTIIAALRHDNQVYLGADSAACAGWNIIVREDRKLFWNRDFLIGCAGSYHLLQIMQYHFMPPSGDGGPDYLMKHQPFDYMCRYFVPELRACLKEHGQVKTDSGMEGTDQGVCIVAYGNNIFTIDNDFHVGMPADPFAAIGCAAQIAHGALYATQKMRDPHKRLTLALQASERFSNGVRGPFVIDWTNV